MYRYSAREFNSRLLTMGSVRVGTLHDFRRSEHKKGIAAPDEGKKTVSHTIGDLHITEGNDQDLHKNKDYRALDAFSIASIDSNCSDIRFENFSVNKKFNEPDCFVFCTSMLQSRSTMSQFEGADTCVLIKDQPAFYEALTDVLNCITPVFFRGVHEAIYQSRDEQWNGRDWGHHPALIKTPDFRMQGEIRAIWQPKFNQPIQPLILGHHCLGRFCEDRYFSKTQRQSVNGAALKELSKNTKPRRVDYTSRGGAFFSSMLQGPPQRQGCGTMLTITRKQDQAFTIGDDITTIARQAKRDKTTIRAIVPRDIWLQRDDAKKAREGDLSEVIATSTFASTTTLYNLAKYLIVKRF